MSHHHYILVGKDVQPVDDPLDWAEWMETPGNKRVALTAVANVKVSTIFLGLNYAPFDGEPPLVFETMVFDSQDNPCPQFGTSRYFTWAEAETGHLETVEAVEYYFGFDADLKDTDNRGYLDTLFPKTDE